MMVVKERGTTVPGRVRMHAQDVRIVRKSNRKVGAACTYAMRLPLALLVV
jgi:hypothetical protein